MRFPPPKKGVTGAPYTTVISFTIPVMSSE